MYVKARFLSAMFLIISCGHGTVSSKQVETKAIYQRYLVDIDSETDKETATATLSVASRNGTNVELSKDETITYAGADLQINRGTRVDGTETRYLAKISYNPVNTPREFIWKNSSGNKISNMISVRTIQLSNVPAVIWKKELPFVMNWSGDELESDNIDVEIQSGVLGWLPLCTALSTDTSPCVLSLTQKTILLQKSTLESLGSQIKLRLTRKSPSQRLQQENPAGGEINFKFHSKVLSVTLE